MSFSVRRSWVPATKYNRTSTERTIHLPPTAGLPSHDPSSRLQTIRPRRILLQPSSGRAVRLRRSKLSSRAESSLDGDCRRVAYGLYLRGSLDREAVDRLLGAGAERQTQFR